jgi:hypothetical protein
MHQSRAILLGVLGLLLLTNTGVRCKTFNSVVIDLPKAEAIFDSDPVPVSVRIGPSFDPLSVEMLLNDTDLIAALGLTPPFSGAGGVANVGGDLVTVSNFNFPGGTGVKFVTLELSALDTDDQELVVRATHANLSQIERLRAFVFVDFFTQELEILSAAGLAEPVQSEVGGSILANASLGDPFAAPPVSLTDGGTLRQGFVEAAEGLIAGAP